MEREESCGSGGQLAEMLCAAATQLGADGITLWISEGDHLKAVANPLESDIVGLRQPIAKGIISEVFLTGQGIVESSPAANPMHDPTIDSRLQRRCTEIMAVPVASADWEGVVSAVCHSDGIRFGRSGLATLGKLAKEISSLPFP